VHACTAGCQEAAQPILLLLLLLLRATRREPTGDVTSFGPNGFTLALPADFVATASPEPAAAGTPAITCTHAGSNLTCSAAADLLADSSW
jgi:hypothetical protein